LTRAGVLGLQRAVGNRAVGKRISGIRSVQRMTVLGDKWAGMTVVRFDPAEPLPVNGQVAGQPNFFFVELPESATQRVYARRPLANLPGAGIAAAAFMKKYLEHLVQRHCPDSAERRRQLRLVSDDQVVAAVGAEFQARRNLVQLRADAALPPANAQHAANWGIVRPLLNQAWDRQPGTAKWSGIKDLFFPNPPNRSQNWWIQYVYQEAQRVDGAQAANLVDRIMYDVNQPRPAVINDAALLRRYLRDLIAVGFFVLTEADFVSQRQIVEERPQDRVSRVTRGAGPVEVRIPRPNFQLYGIGFRAEDRSPAEIIASGGLQPKMETPNDALRQMWNLDSPWFPFDRGKVYFRLGKGDNDLDTLTSFALNIGDVSKFPLLEEPTTVVQTVGARWTSRATISMVRVRTALDTQAMQAATEPEAFGHGEKATLRIPANDILGFLTIERSWDATRARDSNENPHTFTLVGAPDWRGRNDDDLARTLADIALLRANEAQALVEGRAALAVLRAYLAELGNGVVIYDTPTAGKSAASLELPLGSTVLAASARAGSKREKLETLHGRTTVRFGVHYTTTYGQELYVVGDAPELGSWNARAGVLLRHGGGGGNWEGEASLNNKAGGRSIQYKYVVLEAGKDPSWEGGANRSLALGAPGAVTTRNDQWEFMTVRFGVHYTTSFGQELYVAGDGAELGNWNPRAGVLLRHGGGGNWEGEASLNNKAGGRSIQYKYVVVEAGKEPRWEGGDGRTLALGDAGATTRTDQWQV
jgi:hypothetical protein